MQRSVANCWEISVLCVRPRCGRSIANPLRLVVLICGVHCPEMAGRRSLAQQHARYKSCLGWIYHVQPSTRFKAENGVFVAE
jgi:hypothetical protein